MNIYSKLSDWQKRGLITAEQQQKITDYENNVRRPMLYHALLFLSCFCIGIGVIAVIAANWEAIPAAVKLGVDFALLCTAAWGVWHSRRKGRNLAAEALLTAFALLVLGSIGLVGQIYHLPAHGLSALLFWSVLTFPLLFLSSKPLFPGLWFIGFFLSLYDRLSDYRWFADFINRLFDRNANFGIWSRPVCYAGLLPPAANAAASGHSKGLAASDRFCFCILRFCAGCFQFERLVLFSDG